MAFCAHCGLETQESVCPACGTAAPPAAAPSQSAGLDENVANALCYFAWPLTGVLFLVVEPYNRNKNIRFHALQSILVFASLVAGFIALSFLAFMPFVRLIFTMATLAYPLFVFGIWLLLMFKAYTRERFEIPVLGAIARSRA
jgi:uncharacterized membrane protein